MTSPDFRTFVDTLAGGHQAWLASNPSPTGTQVFDHYVGDEALHVTNEAESAMGNHVTTASSSL